MARNSSLWNFDPSTDTRRSTSADPSIDTHRSTSANPLSLSLLVCPYVGVFGFVVFVVDFWFYVCGSVCIRGRRRWWRRADALVLQMEKREKKGVKLEIIKIMYRRATIIVHIYTVTVTLVHLCTILYPLMWVFIWSKCVKWVIFCIL